MIVRIDETTILNISQVLSLMLTTKRTEEKFVMRWFSENEYTPAKTEYVVILEYSQIDGDKYSFTSTHHNINDARNYAKNLADILCKLDDSIMTAELERAISE